MAKFKAEDESKKEKPTKPVKDYDSVVAEEVNVTFNIPDGREGKKAFRETRQLKFGLFQGGARVSEVIRTVEIEYDNKKADVKETDVDADVLAVKAAVETEYKK